MEPGRAARRNAPGSAATAALESEAASLAGHVKEIVGTGPVAAPAVVELLLPGESILAIRRDATWTPLPGGAAAGIRRADIYLTSRRLFFVCDGVVSSDLEDIVEVALAGQALLISMSRGLGVSLLVDRPGAFRANLAAARRASRAANRPTRH